MLVDRRWAIYLRSNDSGYASIPEDTGVTEGFVSILSQRLRAVCRTRGWSWTTMKSHPALKRSLLSGRRCWEAPTGQRSKWTRRSSTLPWLRVKVHVHKCVSRTTVSRNDQKWEWIYHIIYIRIKTCLYWSFSFFILISTYIVIYSKLNPVSPQLAETYCVAGCQTNYRGTLKECPESQARC